METRTDLSDSFSTGLGPPPEKKAKKKAKKKAVPKTNWVPILRVNAYDFDEEVGKFLDSSQTVELQQDTTSKKIRAIIVPD